MNTLTVLSLAFSAVFTTLPPAAASNDAGTQSQPACPADHQLAKPRIQNLLGSPRFPEIRTRFDFGTASLQDLRLLTNPGDHETCGRLWEAMATDGITPPPTDSVTFFKSGNRYMVPVTSTPPLGVIRLDGPSGVNVYDASFRLIGRFRA